LSGDDAGAKTCSAAEDLDILGLVVIDKQSKPEQAAKITKKTKRKRKRKKAITKRRGDAE
jgi:hypothetical protein